MAVDVHRQGAECYANIRFFNVCLAEETVWTAPRSSLWTASLPLENGLVC
jgi:hypothetical protein